MNALRHARSRDDAGARPRLARRRLMLLGTQMLKLAGELSRRGPGERPADSTCRPTAPCSGLLAEEVYRDRRRRARHLPTRLLGEPAWDILLDLYVAAGRGQAVSVSNACLAADAPRLDRAALAAAPRARGPGRAPRRPQSDARRHYVRLTGRGSERMNAYFAECRADLVDELGLETAPAAKGMAKMPG